MATELIEGYAADVMSRIDADSIDLCVTSPPYSDLRDYGKDGGTSFGPDEWRSLFAQLHRVLKPGGVCVWVVADKVINGSKSLDSFNQAIDAKAIGFNVHDVMLFSRNTMPRGGRRYADRFEYMFIFSNGAPKTFNPIMVDCRKAGKLITNFTTRCNGNGDNFKKINGAGKRINAKRKRDSIWQYHVGNGSTIDKFAHEHPAIFPEKLVDDHIVSWSNPGDMVIDPFCGSGTVGKMAMLNGRDFIGIDCNPDYIALSQRRISLHEKAG
jgi:DNA modification methylase